MQRRSLFRTANESSHAIHDVESSDLRRPHKYQKSEIGILHRGCHASHTGHRWRLKLGMFTPLVTDQAACKRLFKRLIFSSKSP